MEKRFILYWCKTSMMNELTVHELSFFSSVIIGRLHDVLVKTQSIISMRSLTWMIWLWFIIFLYLVLSCKLIQSAFHQEIKEEHHCCIVSQMAINICRPKQRMWWRRCWIRKTNQINCHMSNDSFFIENISNRLW